MMPRKAEGRGKIRAELEGVLVTLADLEECVPYVQLRISQAIRRTGMNDLLVPALDELKRVIKDVADAKTQVLSAVERLME
jgi:hypothetical protein